MENHTTLAFADSRERVVSNSYWIDDSRPCITYGLRGVVHAIIDVIGEGRDVHSGVDGGAAVEPMVDMFVNKVPAIVMTGLTPLLG